MNILVTGAAGFIGSHVAEALLARGDDVVGLDNFNDYYDPARKRANVALLTPNPRFTLHEADVRDAEAMERICTAGRFDVVIHLAAMAGVRYSIERAPLYTDVNVRGTVNLLEAARKTGIPHFVFASTSSVYGRTEQLPFREDDLLGRPLAPYPATKIAGEVMGHAYHNLFGLSFTGLRFFSVYGPRGRPDMMPYIITDCIVHGREFVLYEAGEMYRDWTYIADIVSGIVAAVDRPLGYEVINLGRGEPVRMADFVELVEELVGEKARMTTPPAPPSEPPITYADVTKARDLLDYNPTISVADGMHRFWEWYQAVILKAQ
ncbi:MAG TPA: NAD-dependent epimerase/dehydratase family protein [Thermoflexia bacterium]|nr:NAD-dependent epimerase/dehydratase family protein [Thermoflexia bacterium]